MFADDFPDPKVQNPSAIKCHAPQGKQQQSLISASYHQGRILSGLANFCFNCLLGDPAPPRHACWAGELVPKCNGICPMDTAHIPWLLCLLLSCVRCRSCTVLPGCMPRSHCNPAGLVSWLLLPSTQKHVVVVPFSTLPLPPSHSCNKKTRGFAVQCTRVVSQF